MKLNGWIISNIFALILIAGSIYGSEPNDNIKSATASSKLFTISSLPPPGFADLSQKQRILEILSLTQKDLDRWNMIMNGLGLHLSEAGIVEQFKGYFDLKELDWDHYRNEYNDIHRLDRILKAEGKSPDDYKLSKQADFLMSFYNLGESEVTRIIESLGYRLPEDYMKTNFDYYIDRTSHGSTLSRLVHARLAWQMGNREIGWSLYLEALRSDLVDIQGGTTGEGIHCGVMAGTVYDVISTYAGLNLRGNIPELNPSLPYHWKGLDFRFMHRGGSVPAP